MKLHRILVALDSSPRAAGVLAAAQELARANGGKILLLRAVGIEPDIPTTVYASPTDLGTLLLEREGEALKTIAGTVAPELLDGLVTVLGVPWQAICDTAKERAMDLIVIGSHGYGVMDRLLGTTAAKVVNHAPCTTLVVR